MHEKIEKYRNCPESAAKYFAKILAYTIGPAELQDLMSENNIKIIDVRTKEDFDAGHIPSAISIPKCELKDKFHELSKEDIHVIYCYNQQCHLGAKAAFYLSEEGYTAVLLEGGYKVWTEDFRFATSV